MTLGGDGTGIAQWHVDASFAVHEDMRSHTGGAMTMGKGTVIALSKKQKIDAESLTEAELAGVDDALDVQAWTRLFMNEQCQQAGVTERKPDRLCQNNTSAILLECNRRESALTPHSHLMSLIEQIKNAKVTSRYLWLNSNT